MKKIWFKRKTYGWGWYPSTWEGWLVILIWVLLFIPVISKLEDRPTESAIFGIVMAAILIFISYKKGEPPRWQWGGKGKK